MRFLHLSDLHLGKRVCEFSMLDDQRYILEEILSLLDTRPVDAVLLAGDLYDKPVPPAEAVRLLDWFLTELADRKLPVFAISGNHDSAERVAFGAHLLAGSQVYVSPVFEGAPAPIPLTDAYGPVDIYLLPFLKPATVRHIYPDEPIESYSDALGCVLRRCAPDPARRSVLVAHQFVAGATACESEEPSVGGLDCVDAALFDGFDYVALGHLHSPQKVGRDTLRYCGTPLKYSFSEAHQHKSATFVELGPKGEVTLSTAPLTPKHDLRELRGSYMELTHRRLSAHHPDRRTGCARCAGPAAGHLPEPDAAGLRQPPHPHPGRPRCPGPDRAENTAGALCGLLCVAKQSAPERRAGCVLPAAH